MVDLKAEFWANYHRAGRNEMPALLLRAWLNETISDDECREHICHAYNAAEWPCRLLPPEAWVATFQRLGWAGDLPRPEEPTVLYRAQVGKDLGLSWTPDLQMAEFFHGRNLLFGFEEAEILAITAQPDWVVARFTGREGEEFLVDPARIPDST